LDKATLKSELYDTGEVMWFQQHDYRWGHASTNYWLW